jgi:imidazolonepropionase-like amidohydrolase
VNTSTDSHDRLTAIAHVDVLDAGGDRILPDRTITFSEDGTIGSVTGGETEHSTRPDGRSLDGSGLVVIPGLIDTHVHLFRRGGDDPRGEYLASNDADRMATAVSNAAAALAHGVTSVRDLASPAELMRQLTTLISSGTVPGPSIVWTGASITRPGGDDHYFGGEVEVPAGAIALIDSQVAMGARCVTLVVTGGGLTPGTDPSAVELPADVMTAAVAAGRRHGTQIVARAHATEGIRAALAMGVDTIEHASFLQEGKTVFDDDIALRIKTAGISVGPTVFGSLRAAARYRTTGPANPADRGAVARLEARVDNARRWMAHGVRLAAGSSAGSIDVPPWGIVEETIAYVDLGMSAAQALLASTADAAAVINVPAGAIRAGLSADLALLATSPLDDIAALRTPVGVIKNGRLVAGDLESRLA